MDKKDSAPRETKFLHDIATPMSTFRLHTRRLQKMCASRPDCENELKVIEQMMKAIEAMESLHASYKSEIVGRLTEGQAS